MSDIFFMLISPFLLFLIPLSFYFLMKRDAAKLASEKTNVELNSDFDLKRDAAKLVSEKTSVELSSDFDFKFDFDYNIAINGRNEFVPAMSLNSRGFVRGALVDVQNEENMEERLFAALDISILP